MDEEATRIEVELPQASPPPHLQLVRLDWVVVDGAGADAPPAATHRNGMGGCSRADGRPGSSVGFL